MAIKIKDQNNQEKPIDEIYTNVCYQLNVLPYFMARYPFTIENCTSMVSWLNYDGENKRTSGELSYYLRIGSHPTKETSFSIESVDYETDDINDFLEGNQSFVLIKDNPNTQRYDTLSLKAFNNEYSLVDPRITTETKIIKHRTKKEDPNE